MSAATVRGVCRRCARRAWLLGRLGVRLNLQTRDPERLWGTLGLGDRELIEALGGRRRAQLHDEYASWGSDRDEVPLIAPPAGADAVCRHHCAYPARLRGDPLAPTALVAAGGVERMRKLLAHPVVAIVGTAQASDYGMSTAGRLTRELLASRVTVAGALGDGIGVAVHAGALACAGGAVAVAEHGLDSRPGSWSEALELGLRERGCLLAELSSVGRQRDWRQLGCARTLALLADLVVIVEADESSHELACAELARSRGIPLAAIPGELDSPTSLGTNALILAGARLLRDAKEALDLLHARGAGKRGQTGGDERRLPAPMPAPALASLPASAFLSSYATTSAPASLRSLASAPVPMLSSASAPALPHAAGVASTTTPAPIPALPPELAKVLARVERGQQTLASLCEHESDCDRLATALTELELLGALRRDECGRYRPADDRRPTA